MTQTCENDFVGGLCVFYQALSLGSLTLPFPPLSRFLQSCVLAALLELPSFLQVGCSVGHDVNFLLGSVLKKVLPLHFVNLYMS